MKNGAKSPWPTAQLGDLLIRLANGTTATQSKEPPGIPVSRIETISNATINYEKVHYVRDLEEKKKELFLVQQGDILFSHINSDLHLGKSALATGCAELLHGMNLLLMRPSKELDSKFLNYFLTQLRYSGFFISIAQHAVNQSSLNQQKLKAIEIPLPPLPEQRRIVARIEELFSHLDAGVAALRHAKAQLQRYRQSVLAAAFSGDLIGKQNPIDCNTDVPVGWSEAVFGDVVENVSINEKKLPQKQYAESGRFPVVDQGQDFIGGYSDDASRLVSENLPLLVFGDHTRIFKYLSQPFIPGADGVKVLKPKGVSEKWLFYIGQALDFPDKGYARHFSHLKKARLLIPPLCEQHQIVAEVEARTTAIDHLEAELDRQITRANRLRQSTLSAAFHGNL